MLLSPLLIKAFCWVMLRMLFTATAVVLCVVFISRFFFISLSLFSLSFHFRVRASLFGCCCCRYTLNSIESSSFRVYIYFVQRKKNVISVISFHFSLAGSVLFFISHSPYRSGLPLRQLRAISTPLRMKNWTKSSKWFLLINFNYKSRFALFSQFLSSSECICAIAFYRANDPSRLSARVY